MPVSRPAGALRHPTAERFLTAAATCGFPAEPDKNAGGPPGAGLVPGNAVDGVRVNPALAYLREALELPTGPPRRTETRGDDPGRMLQTEALTVRGDVHAERIVLDGTRAVGVGLADGTVVRAGEVVLAAGAVGTPHLLLRSGIGPADDLRAAGVDVVHHLPGVGRGFTDHPAVFLPFTTGDPPAHPHARAAQAALDLDAGADPAGDCEVLLFARPFVPGGPLHLMCQLMYPDSRGTLTLTAADGAAPHRLPLPAHRARPPPPAARGPDRRRPAPRRSRRPGRARRAPCWDPTGPSTAGSPRTSPPPSTCAAPPRWARRPTRTPSSIPSCACTGSSSCASSTSPCCRSRRAGARRRPRSRSGRRAAELLGAGPAGTAG